MRAMHLQVAAWAALACATMAGGCASPRSNAAAYEQALSQWQGAPEDTLRARWGKPFAEEPAGNAKWLTYVVSNGAVAQPAAAAASASAADAGRSRGVGRIAFSC